MLSPRGPASPLLIRGGGGQPRRSAPIRRLLRSQGYWTHGWRLGRNLGPTPAVIEGPVDRPHTIHARPDRPVSLIGWSLGGIFARELAREFPEEVRLVVTLGSPA